MIEKRKRTDAFCLIDIHENGRSKPFSPPRQRTCQRRRCTVIFHGACSSPTRGTLRAMNDRRAGQARRTGEGKSKERRRRYSAEHGAHRRSRRRGHQAVRGGALHRRWRTTASDGATKGRLRALTGSAAAAVTGVEEAAPSLPFKRAGNCQAGFWAIFHFYI